MSGVEIKHYGSVPPNLREIYRYAGGRAGDEALEESVKESLSELDGRLSFSVCYREFDLKKEGDLLDLGFAKTDSKHLSDLLCDCDRILLFAATIGSMPDRLLLKYGRISPVKALTIDAVGSERVESLCELFVKERAKDYQKEGFFLTPRFSPGYGDLPLALQKEIFLALTPEKHLGLTLGESLLMWPCKSVTALAGIGKRKK